MNKNIFGSILVLTGIGFLVFLGSQNIGHSQIMVPKDIYMFGTIENDGIMSGYFGKQHSDMNNQNWCVFIGSDGKVYKLDLLNKNIRALHIDGKKIPDSEISLYKEKYNNFLEKFQRSEEIEIESRELERKIKPIDRKMEAINKEIESLDRTEEKLNNDSDKRASNFIESKTNIRSQQQKLSVVQAELDEQLEYLSKQQEKLSSEQEKLDLLPELNKVLTKISADLKSLGVVKNLNAVSFKLSNRELIVNGKKITTEVFELLKNKYIVDNNGETGFIYQWKGDI